MSNIVNTFGKRLRSYRKKQGLTLEKLEEASGIHNKYIGQIERAEKNPSLETLEKLAIGLNLPLEKLVEKIVSSNASEEETDYPLEMYNIMLGLNTKQQEKIISIVKNILSLLVLL
ncbi:transcriptional regulator [Clostridia bacterium]|nr:transcriptional regulator [Clostridia bacterium]